MTIIRDVDDKALDALFAVQLIDYATAVYHPCRMTDCQQHDGVARCTVYLAAEAGDGECMDYKPDPNICPDCDEEIIHDFVVSRGQEIPLRPCRCE